MEDIKIRKYCKSILPFDVNEAELWRTSTDTKEYVRKVQQFSFVQSPPAYVSPSPIVPSLSDILQSPEPDANESGIFNCRRCRKRIVNYKTEQRRSADEGCTIIGTCESCGVQTIRNT